MTADRKHRAWQAAARLLQRREEELRAVTARWQAGLVPFKAFVCLKDEVFALWEFERDLFHKAFPSTPRRSPGS